MRACGRERLPDQAAYANEESLAVVVFPIVLRVLGTRYASPRGMQSRRSRYAPTLNTGEKRTCSSVFIVTAVAWPASILPPMEQRRRVRATACALAACIITRRRVREGEVREKPVRAQAAQAARARITAFIGLFSLRYFSWSEPAPVHGFHETLTRHESRLLCFSRDTAYESRLYRLFPFPGPQIFLLERTKPPSMVFTKHESRDTKRPRLLPDAWVFFFKLRPSDARRRNTGGSPSRSRMRLTL